MRKWILFISGMALIFLGVVLFKSKENTPVVKPITLKNARQMELDIHTLEEMYQNNKLLPRPKQKNLAIKFPQKQEDQKKSEAAIRVEQELLWQEEENTKSKEDEEEKSSFSRWLQQKLYGIKMRLKLPF